MTGYCTTWNGEGDAAAGTRQAATEIDFHTDIDEDGVELVSVEEVQQVSSSDYCPLFSLSYLQRPQRLIFRDEPGVLLVAAEKL